MIAASCLSCARHDGNTLPVSTRLNSMTPCKVDPVIVPIYRWGKWPSGGHGTCPVPPSQEFGSQGPGWVGGPKARIRSSPACLPGWVMHFQRTTCCCDIHETWPRLCGSLSHPLLFNFFFLSNMNKREKSENTTSKKEKYFHHPEVMLMTNVILVLTPAWRLLGHPSLGHPSLRTSHASSH